MMTLIPHPVASAAAARPEAEALRCPDGPDGEIRLTWAQLAEAVAQRAGILRAEGVTPGDRVALAGAWGAGWIVSFHALTWIGATAALLPPEPTERLKALEIFAPAQIIDVAELPLAALLGAEGAGAPVGTAGWDLAQPVVMVATSGTTGRPRAIPLTGHQLVFSAFGSAIRLGHLPTDRWLGCLPLHHVGGLSILIRTALYATGAVIHRRFEAEAVAAALDSGEITHVSLVPNMLARVLDARPARPFPEALRVILLGGAATPAALKARCAALGAPVSVTWGMSEAASQVATARPGDLDGDHVGHPLAFAQVSTVAEGPEAGALQIHGPVVPGGHLITGDRGHLDAEGRVIVQGRRDGMIISGGENIDPVEVERILCGHPAIEAAVVVGVDHARWGQRPAALLVPAEGLEDAALPDPEALKRWCGDHLAAYKAPDRYVWHRQPPRTALGKLARGQIAALLRGPDPLADDMTSEYAPVSGDTCSDSAPGDHPLNDGGGEAGPRPSGDER